MSDRPPFRADHVGSFLRPKTVVDARVATSRRRDRPRGAERGRRRSHCRSGATAGGHRPSGHHRRRVPALHVSCRLPGATGWGDGHRGQFPRQVPSSGRFRDRVLPADHGGRRTDPPRPAHPGRRFRLSRSQVTKTPKVSIPAPSMLHFRGGRQGISEDVYPISSSSSMISPPPIGRRSPTWPRGGPRMSRWTTPTSHISAQRALGEDRVTYSSLEVDIDRARRTATLTIIGPEDDAPIRTPASGPCVLARELDDAILHLRVNELEIGTLILRSAGDPALVERLDRRLGEHGGDWFLRKWRSIGSVS